jgi:hypothetical protein
MEAPPGLHRTADGPTRRQLQLVRVARFSRPQLLDRPEASHSIAHSPQMMPLSPSDTPLGSGFVLISSTSGKPDPDTRRRIRRHVMRGKNTRRQGHNEDERQLLSNSEQWTLTSPRKITSELSLLTGVPYMQQLIYRGVHWLPLRSLPPRNND